jgi:hypothetical protein
VQNEKIYGKAQVYEHTSREEEQGVFMSKFNLEDYEPVEERIKRFYADHPDGRIITELISSPNDIDTVVVKAVVYADEIPRATGLAFEKAGEGYVNKTSHLENCETSAIGRALANFNYQGNKRPSREEMQKVQESPRDKVIAEIRQVCKEKHLPKDKLAELKEDIDKSDLERLENIKTALVEDRYFSIPA